MSDAITHSAAYKTPTAGNSTFSISGPVLEFLVTPKQAAEQFTVIKGTMRHEVTVPLHSHPEVEWMFILEGTMQVWADSPEQPQWFNVAVGESVLIPSNARHALRNISGNSVSILLMTAARLGHFFEQVAAPLAPGEQPMPPPPERIQKFLEVQQQYGYWSASPEENAAVGIQL